jgi:hypothetical protein
MESESWTDASGLPLPQQQQQQPLSTQALPQQQQQQQLEPLHHQDQLDRQMLRHLLKKYSAAGISRLLEEEAASPDMQDDGASVFTSSTYSSVKSEDAPSIFDSGSSIRTSVSDTTSSARNSILSNMSARTAKLLGRKNTSASSALRRQASMSQMDDPSATQWDPSELQGDSSASGSKQKGTFTCGFCSEEDIQKTCTRKNDLKRHIEDFHNMNAQWTCPQRDCNMVFDWQTAYKTHLKHAHGGVRISPDEAKIDLCPQTIFACGFENCIQVFESPSEAEASTTFKEYVAHVVKHLDEGSSCGDWTYSTRMRNLLRQCAVSRHWTNSQWPEAERNSLTWQPQSSGVLRKCLETKHLGEIGMLIQYAYELGSGANPTPGLHESFLIPTKGQCQMHTTGPKMRLQPGTSMAPEPEGFQFRISRDPNTNPSLANYYANQRRQYNPRAPVRTGRSARPPMRAMTQPTNGVGPHQAFHQQPAPNMFDPTGFYAQHQHQQHQHQQNHQQHQQQHPQQQQFALMSPVSNGGIISDDLRSLRSMASSNSSTDLEMSDAGLMNTSYLPQQDFSSSFTHNGLQSPAPTEGCNIPNPSEMKMGQASQFVGYDHQQTY